MATTEEYNKIHAMARARKLVMQKFGANLLNFWPMADDGLFIRDLLRNKPLVGSGIALQQGGMLDYSVDLQGGYLSDIGADLGDTSGSDAPSGSYPCLACKMPPGCWRGVQVRARNSSTSDIQLRAIIGPANTLYSDRVGKAIYVSDWQTTPSESDNLYTYTFPRVIYAPPDLYWVYVDYGPGGLYPKYASPDLGFGSWYTWSGTAWQASYSYARIKLLSKDAETWSSYSQFTLCALVNVDNSPCDGVVVAIADASESKARLYITSAGRVEGKVKNAGGTLYTLTGPSQLHPGFNLLTLSYDQNIAVKLGVNGLVVATATPSNYGLFNATLALGVGAQMLTGKTTSGQLKNALVDDVFLAKGVVADSALWDIYTAYITAAPLMQVEDVTPA